MSTDTPEALSPSVGIAVLIGLAGYAVFGWRIRTASAPLIDPGLVRRGPVLVALGLIFVATALMISVFFLGSFTLQHVHGYTPLETGLSFLPGMIRVVISRCFSFFAMKRRLSLTFSRSAPVSFL